MENINNETAAKFAERMAEIREEAASALIRAAELMKRYYNKKRQPDPGYKAGDLVLLDGRDLKIDRPAVKLSDKLYGPYKVLDKVGNLSYRLQIPQGWLAQKVHPVFNTVKFHP